MLNILHKSDSIFFSWVEGNTVYSFEKVPVNSSLPLHLCLHSIFGRGSGIIAMFRVLLGPSKLEMHSKSKIPELLSSLFLGYLSKGGLSYSGNISLLPSV